jgi:hypothetical protein
MRPVHWVWEGRIPLGAISLLGGREGIGKSVLVYQRAADLTKGALPGRLWGAPRSVLVAATEDSWAQTIVPRLVAAEADLKRVYRVQVTVEELRRTELTLPADLPGLERMAKKVGAGLLILDPLLSRLSGKLDTHADAEVRRAMEPLAALAESAKLSIVGLIHVNKSQAADILDSIMASKAFVAVPRAILFATRDPEDKDRIFVGQAKNNLGRLDMPCLAFRIHGTKVADSDEGPVLTARLEWDGEDSRSIQEIVDASKLIGSADTTAVALAAEWLRDYLEKEHVVWSQQAKRVAKEEGHPERTLERARVKIGAGVQSFGFPRRTFWSERGLTPDQVKAFVDENDLAPSS